MSRVRKIASFVKMTENIPSIYGSLKFFTVLKVFSKDFWVLFKYRYVVISFIRDKKGEKLIN